MLLAALALAAAPAPRPVPVKPRPPAAARIADWTKVVSATSRGFVMGNPKATVKMVEYGSLTCPHCRDFDAEASAKVETLVHGGKVSFEFRSFLLNGVDIPATLAAGCGGPSKFFPMLHALFASQRQWVGKLQALPPERMTAIQALPPAQQYATIGAAADFASIGAAHGISPAQMTACLSDAAAGERLAKITVEGGNSFGVEGTPTFFVNNTKVDFTNATSFWDGLDRALNAALRG